MIRRLRHMRAPRRAGASAALGLAVLAACDGGPAAVSGTIEPNRVDVSAEVTGRVVTVAVAEGATVAPGEPLVVLDCEGPEAERTRAAALVAQAVAQRDLVEAGARTQEIVAAEAQVEAARQRLAAARTGATREQVAQIDAALQAVQARISLAEETVRRLERLEGEGTVSVADADAARAQLATLQAERAALEAQRTEARAGARAEDRAVLEAQLREAENRLDLLREGSRSEERAAAEAQVQAAQAALGLAELAVERCTVRSPVAGVVDIVDFEPGEVVPAGASVVAIERDGPPRVRTYAPQVWLGFLTVGDVVTVRVDGFDAPLEATVARIHEEPSFTAGNVQTPDDRMLLVYPLDLELAPVDAVPLRAGMTVTVEPPSGSPGR